LPELLDNFVIGMRAIQEQIENVIKRKYPVDEHLTQKLNNKG
jgi:hypothetical protein